MIKALNLIKDEYKQVMREKINKAVTNFVNLTEDDQDSYFCGEGTIGYFFDDNHIGFDDNINFDTILIEQSEENEELFIDAVCEYLDSKLD